MPVTHYREAGQPANVVACCGRQITPTIRLTTDPGQTTCLSCQTSTRWLMSVKGMTWEQAQKHRFPRY